MITGTARFDDIEVQPFTEYWYKVSIVKLSGNERDIELIDAHAANTKLKRHSGFPVDVYPSAASGCFSSPAVYDINGDGNKEIFLNYLNQWDGSTMHGKIMGFYATGQELFDIDNDPTQVWGLAATDLELWSNPAIGNIDNVGNAEVFAIGRKHESNMGQLYGYHTVDANNNGQPDMWGDDFQDPGYINLGERTRTNPILADLDNDGFLEVIVFDEHQKVLVYDRNKVLLGTRQPYDTGYSEGELAVADIDGDGYKEIVLSCQKNSNNKGAIYIWNHNGVFSGGSTDNLNLLKEFNTGERADNGAILADIDNNGIYEVLTITRDANGLGHVYALHADNGNPVNSSWNGSFVINLTTAENKESVIPRIAVGDLNNDGSLEVVFGSYDKLYALDHNGVSLNGFPITITTMEQSSPILADIDDDDEIEIIINQMAFEHITNQIKGEIHAFNYDGSPCFGWVLKSDTDAPFVNSPFVGDIDNDGFNEMVISTLQGSTYVWDTTGDADKVEWGSYRENAQNTAVYKEKCTFSSLGTVEVTGTNVIWNTDRHIQGDLVIKPNAKLTITSKVTFTRNSKLVVEQGGKLTLDGVNSVLTTECGALWKGIRVKGNKNLSQTAANQGTLILKNAATIAHAEVAVYAGNDPASISINTGSGGIVQIDNAIFTDNVIGVELPSYSFANISHIKNSNFQNSDYLTSLDHYPEANILLWKVGTIQIEGNTFKNLQEIKPYTNPHNLPIQGNGIVGTDAKISILDNTFENLNSAIKIAGTGSVFALTSVTISDNNFNQNWNAVNLNNILGVEITSNSIDVFDTFLDGQGVDGSSGLYIVNSNGFHIENNNIYSSSAQGFSTGIFIRDCKAANEIYRNQFSDLYTGVFAMGKNTASSSGIPVVPEGLKLICNEFDTNNTDIYVASNSTIAKYQGTATVSAGNTFLPECTGTINEFNNQGTQVVYMGETGGIYLPDCNYNVNVFSSSGHNGCESTLRPGFDSSDVAQMDANIEQNRTTYMTLTDGGDTEGLSETIEETPSNEALLLRNELLQESPFLSDTIMVQTTMVENVLPSLMVKDVLAANPNAAKSDQVQQALDNRQNQLPVYMRDEINLGRTILSSKEDLEDQLSRDIHKRENMIDMMVANFLRDTLPGSLDSLKTLLVAEAQNRILRNYQLIDVYLGNSEAQNAQALFNAIPQNFVLTTPETNEYNKLSDLLDIKLDLWNNDKSWFAMDSTQVTTVNLLAMDSTTIAGMQSRAILSLVNKTDYGLPIPAKVQSGNRSSNGPETIPGTFAVYPEIANDYFIVEYALANDEDTENATIRIMDNNNKEVKTLKVLTRENQFLVECDIWKEGAYWCEKTIEGSVIARQKVLIDRGHLPIELTKTPNMPEDEIFQIFPNPVRDYFIVRTNVQGEAILQVTNSLGQDIAHFVIKSGETKVSTASWSKGVYYVVLNKKDKNSHTIKIIAN